MHHSIKSRKFITSIQRASRENPDPVRDPGKKSMEFLSSPLSSRENPDLVKILGKRTWNSYQVPFQANDYKDGATEGSPVEWSWCTT